MTTPTTLAAAAAPLRRWFVVYLCLCNVPFPLDQLPGLGDLVHELAAPWRELVAAVGALLGVEAVPRYNGSGDTTYHYVSALCVALLAALVAIAWSLRARELSGRVVDRARAYVRLALGTIMLSYGWVKLIPLQFPAPGPDRLIIPYGDSSPMGLLWTTMGHSAGYEMFSGALEVAGGLLLFFRRTALAGALLSALALTNVVALNFCFDVPVKLFSSHLLAMALFVLAPDLGRLLAVVFNRPAAARELDPHPIARPLWRRAAFAAKLGLFALALVLPIVQSAAMLTTTGRLAPRDPLHGVYRVKFFTRGDAGDRDVPDDQRWLRVGINQLGVGAIQMADGTGARFRLKIDRERGVMKWTPLGGQEGFELRYGDSPFGDLRLVGAFAGVQIDATLRKQPDDFLLTSRPFRWVHEAPFNR